MTDLRKKRLIEPKIQLRFFVLFLSTVVLAALVQAIVLGYVLVGIAGQMPSGGETVAASIPGALALGMGLTVLVLAPVTLALGVMTTFPIVGPLYRMRTHLARIVAGERPGRCSIRQGDELQDFCELLNQALEPVQSSAEEQASSSLEPRQAA